MRGNSRGSALIEVLAAIVILSGAGVSLTLLLGQTEHSMRALRDAERREREASSELARFVTLGRDDFLALQGGSVHRGFRTVVTEREHGLFDVALSDSDSTPAILRTTFYRPDSANVAP